MYEASSEYGLTGEVNVYDTVITCISIDEQGVAYYCEVGDEEIEENKVILYEDTEKLLEKIKEVMEKIHEREEKENKQG